MIGQIIAIGDELISGRVINTTSSFAASRLFSAGHRITKITVIGDEPGDIKACLGEALKSSQFILISGGLGPTTDDITNEAVAEALGLSLVQNQQVVEQIKNAEMRFGHSASERFKQKLTMLPEGATVLEPTGCAAGYWLFYNGVYLFFLPGVPEQLEDHVVKRVLPMLNSLDPERPFVVQKIFKLFGISETNINIELEALQGRDPSLKIGYYPVFPEVHVSLTASKPTLEDAKEIIRLAASHIEEKFHDFIVAEDSQGSLQATVGEILKDRDMVLAAAESCTGGLLGATVTSVPGSSQWFDRSIVTYSNRAKKQNLGVSDETLTKYGAVSSQTAIEMAKGVGRISGADCRIAITGIAGPGGGTDEKPVGTVYISVAVREEYLVHRFHFPGSRKEIRMLSVETALDWLRRYLSYGSKLPGYKPVS